MAPRAAAKSRKAAVSNVTFLQGRLPRGKAMTNHYQLSGDPPRAVRIGVIGNGVVGNATARVWMEHAEVRVYDVVAEKATHGLDEVLQSDLVFVCLPTPQSSDGYRLDTTVLQNFLGLIRTGSDALPHRGNLVVRSTVPVGFTAEMSRRYNLPNLIHSPEFLTARCAVTDAHLPSRNIIGVPSPDGTRSRKWPSEAAALYTHLLLRRFPGVPVLGMHSTTSELVKLVVNGFFAVKVAFFNEVNSYCTAQGVAWADLIAGVLSDGRIAHAHTQVPGPDGKYGFGGDCLPKDLAELVNCLGEYGMVCNAAQRRNAAVDRQRTR